MEPLVKKALACIDLVELSNLVLDDVLEAAVNKVVEKSDNKIDDAVAALLLPILKAELKKIIADKVAELKA
jgi:hypothetical protein